MKINQLGKVVLLGTLCLAVPQLAVAAPVAGQEMPGCGESDGEDGDEGETALCGESDGEDGDEGETALCGESDGEDGDEGETALCGESDGEDGDEGETARVSAS